MWLVACFSPLCTFVFPPALTISCSIFFAAFNGLISMFTSAYYLADTWNSSNILIERFTRVPNFGVAKMGRNEVKILGFISIPSYSSICWNRVTVRERKWNNGLYLTYQDPAFSVLFLDELSKYICNLKKETSWKIDYRLINNSEQQQSLQKTVRYFKHRQTTDIPLKMIQKCQTSMMPNFSAKNVF